MLRYVAPLLILLAAAPTIGGSETITIAEFEQTLLARDLEVMSLTTNAAKLIREGRTETALRLLEQRLASSVMTAGQRVDAGVRIPGAHSANLVSAPARTAKYAASQKQDVLAAQAAALSAKLVAGAASN